MSVGRPASISREKEGPIWTAAIAFCVSIASRTASGCCACVTVRNVGAPSIRCNSSCPQDPASRFSTMMSTFVTSSVAA